ncbi:Uncharacterised protein [uncultured archaeon]|nr:Uncharacterised protein [uncultured archaeon]
MGAGSNGAALLDAGPQGRVPVYNFGTGQQAAVSPARLSAILKKIGRDPEGVQRIFLSDGNVKALPYPPDPATLLLDSRDEIKLVWQDILKKGPDSLYPPLSPREIGNLVVSMAYANGGNSYGDLPAVLESKLSECRELDDLHSARYLENGARILNEALGPVRSARKLMEQGLKSLSDNLELGRQRAQKEADDMAGIARDKANRTLDKLQGYLDMLNFGTLLRFVVPSVGAAAVAVYTTITEWLSAWPPVGKAGLVAGAVGILTGGAFAFRNYVRRRIRRATGEQKAEMDKARDDGLRREKQLMSENERHEDQLARRFERAVQRYAMAATLKCFMLCMEFFPEYVKEELRLFGSEWGARGFSGAEREEATRLLMEGLRRQNKSLALGPDWLGSKDENPALPA